MTNKSMPIKWMILLSLNLAMVLAAILFPLTRNHEPSHTLDQLNGIQTQLNHLEETLKTPSEKIDALSINQDFKHLETLIDELKTKDERELNQLVIDSRTQLQNKLDAMHTTINSLNTKQHPIKYLDINALPFHVISIDSIQHVSVASVEYDYRTIPLEKNDALAGWMVLIVDFSKQKIEFENSNKERVVVALDGAKDHA